MRRFQSLIKSEEVGKEKVKEINNSGCLEKLLFKWKWTFKTFELPWKDHWNLASENLKKIHSETTFPFKNCNWRGPFQPCKRRITSYLLHKPTLLPSIFNDPTETVGLGFKMLYWNQFLPALYQCCSIIPLHIFRNDKVSWMVKENKSSFIYYSAVTCFSVCSCH